MAAAVAAWSPVIMRTAMPAERHEAMALLDPEGMGTEIRVLVQGREIGTDGLFDLPLGFA